MPETMLVNLWVKPMCIWYVLFTSQQVLKRRLFTEEHWITLTFMINYVLLKSLLNPWPLAIHSIDFKIEFLLKFSLNLCLLHHQWKLMYSSLGGKFLELLILWSFVSSDDSEGQIIWDGRQVPLLTGCRTCGFPHCNELFKNLTWPWTHSWFLIPDWEARDNRCILKAMLFYIHRVSYFNWEDALNV